MESGEGPREIQPELPLEVIADLNSMRHFEEGFGGIMRNNIAFWEYAQAEGHDMTELLDEETDIMERATSIYKQRLEQDSALRELHDNWLRELNMRGFTRLFGQHEHEMDDFVHYDHEFEFRKTAEGDVKSLSQIMYIGELPPSLATEPTEAALQSLLDLRYGTHGAFITPTSHITVLYPDISVSLSPFARTIVQNTKTIWHIETAAFIREYAGISVRAQDSI